MNLLRRLLVTLSYRFWSPGILYWLKRCEADEWKTASELNSIQEARLRSLLEHAAQHVPYYRTVLRSAGVITDSGVDLHRFTLIPPLTKEIIRREGERLYADDYRSHEWYKNTSGGSTGDPVTFLQDGRYRESSWANGIISARMAGKRDGESEIRIGGSERDIFQGSIGWRAKLENWLYHRTLLNSFRMTEATMDRYLNLINAQKPKTLWAYVDSLYELARRAEKTGYRMHKPKTIILAAGTVFPKAREIIERVFQTKAFNHYGSREAGGMAAECEAHDGLHVFSYQYVFEILNDRGMPCAPEEIGEIYVTVLSNYAMPLIRYRIGDTASWTKEGECSCGRKTARITTVHGRSTDHFRKADGTVVHGEYFTHLFYFRSWVKKFKIVQKTFSAIECLVVAEGKPNETDVKDIIEKIQIVMGADCAVTFSYVGDIPPSHSGKYLYTKSEVPFS